MSIPNLLFIDTNIWLDFYRARNDTGLKLLAHTEKVADRLIVTYQLESEFKRNRQEAILEGMRELKAPQQMSRPGIFSDAKAIKAIAKGQKQAEQRVKDLQKRLVRVLENPGLHDPVYKVCQRVFHKKDDIVLTRDDARRHVIRRNAFRRFLHGAPPGKKNQVSIGDAFNWEWMVYCATLRKAGLVIVTRDGDYGVTSDGKSYINDHLRQEFSERVSRKRDLILHSRLSEALKLFAVDVSPQEAEIEEELATSAPKEGAITVSGVPVSDSDLVFLRSILSLTQSSKLGDTLAIRDFTIREPRKESDSVQPVQVQRETEKEGSSREFAATNDKGQPGEGGGKAR